MTWRQTHSLPSRKRSRSPKYITDDEVIKKAKSVLLADAPPNCGPVISSLAFMLPDGEVRYLDTIHLGNAATHAGEAMEILPHTSHALNKLLSRGFIRLSISPNGVSAYIIGKPNVSQMVELRRLSQDVPMFYYDIVVQGNGKLYEGHGETWQEFQAAIRKINAEE